jgi:hypothetical protein
MPVPDFSPGEVLTSSAMDSIGLWLVKTQTIGAGVTSVTVTDAFSNTYDNYKIMISGGVASSSGEMNIRLGATTSGYHVQFVFTAWNNTVSSDSSKTQDKFAYVGSATTSNLIADITVLSPNLAKNTRVSAPSTGDGTSYVGNMSGLLPNSTQYTDFTIFISNATPTMTGGTIRVYGYRN